MAFWCAVWRWCPVRSVAFHRGRVRGRRGDARGVLGGGRSGVRYILVVVTGGKDHDDGGGGEQEQELFHKYGDLIAVVTPVIRRSERGWIPQPSTRFSRGPLA